MNTFIIRNVNIVTEYGIIDNGYMFVKRGIIQNVGRADPGRVHRSCSIIDGKNGMLMPGFIDISNSQLTEVDTISFNSIEKTLYTHGITSVFHMISDYENTDDNRLNQLRRLGLIRHQFLTKLPVLNSYYIIGSSVLNRAVPIHGSHLETVQGCPSPDPIISDMVKHPSMYIICSDSADIPIMHGSYDLIRLFYVRPEEAVGMISINPARALGIDGRLGSIEAGKRADLVLTNNRRDYPDICKVFVSGCIIYDREEPQIREE